MHSLRALFSRSENRVMIKGMRDFCHGKNDRGVGGFTLIEILLVLGILAVVSAVTIIVLNPANLSRKARDSKRVAELAALNEALNLAAREIGASSMGNPKTVYVSLPDTSPTCANLALPPLPSGWTYACRPAADVRKIDGTGWVPVDFTTISVGTPLSHLPLDPKNTTDGFFYFTYVAENGAWELNGTFESTSYREKLAADGGDSSNFYEVGTNVRLAPLTWPHNWVLVPGNAAYGTSDFWVMQYEAKYSKDGGGPGDAAQGCRVFPSDDSWNWGDNSPDCPSAWHPNNVVSSAEGSPIAGLTYNEALAACPSGSHLITNDEWMTIARNVEQVAKNWSGGAVGSGCLFRGNVNGDDGTCGYDGANPENGLRRNPHARLFLSNGGEIWDLAGNMWEYVQRTANPTITEAAQPDAGLSTGVFRASEFTAIVNDDGLSPSEYRPSNSSWNSAQGMGKIWHCDTCTGTAQRIFIRGSDSYGFRNSGEPSSVNAEASGVYAIALNRGPDDTSGLEVFGFRCAR
ncbi:type II secretion system protein [Candidatus Parcubacteria bacterium]|nr:MAG: type II secretion system protein [Candidatus Parcubacteria bacterium]